MNERPNLTVVDGDKPTEPVVLLKIVLSEQEPIRIVEADWPIVASLKPTDAMHSGVEMFIRQHRDGRRIVYGVNPKLPAHYGGGIRYAGTVLKAGDDAKRAIESLVMQLVTVSLSYTGMLLSQLSGNVLR